MTVYAVYNIKGGVGKTTSTVNLSYLSARQNDPTLIWDLDPQAGTSFYLGVKPKVKGGGRGLLENRHDLDVLLRMTGYPNLDLLPADLSYRHFDTLLSEQRKPLEGIKRVLKPLRKEYENIFLDCPPGLTLLSESIFEVADVLLVPLIPTTLSLRAYNRLVRFLSKQEHKKMLLLPFFNLVNLNKPIHKVVSQTVPSKHAIFCRHFIEESNLIEAMGVKRAPVTSFAKGTPDATRYEELWNEVQNRYKNHTKWLGKNS
ncbi:Cobyrinic acid a,c-diamide synthase [Magnetococcus marinus MC-1]|uniref:Cobyrinic acid a,c-diamide synthase n=1 Tax=Magnetococcus marinus (strain ATCC BAA-1437 / JCM 17883 / MC-1) TaxID=156889 RepID=A0L9F8_MAGMM|nr:AAA family ATPase [Magnetococcus marinus]ABK44601.1 Cobyrinic acid a,c-diamide synthase [Magnetococcus marinus MC-1]